MPRDYVSYAEDWFFPKANNAPAEILPGFATRALEELIADRDREYGRVRCRSPPIK